MNYFENIDEIVWDFGFIHKYIFNQIEYTIKFNLNFWPKYLRLIPNFEIQTISNLEKKQLTKAIMLGTKYLVEFLEQSSGIILSFNKIYLINHYSKIYYVIKNEDFELILYFMKFLNNNLTRNMLLKLEKQKEINNVIHEIINDPDFYYRINWYYYLDKIETKYKNELKKLFNKFWKFSIEKIFLNPILYYKYYKNLKII